MSGLSTMLCLGLFLLVTPLLTTATYWGSSQYGYYGHYRPYGQQECTWGGHAVAVYGQCNAFQCVSPWFRFPGESYCLEGTLFSAREARCVSPLWVAAQCSASSSQQAKYWYWL